MKEFLNRDFYNEFIKHCNNQKNTLNKELHIYLSELYVLNYKLLDDYNLLIKYNIKIYDILECRESGRKIRYNLIDEKDSDFIITYNLFLVTLQTIKELKTLYLRYSFLSNIPYSVYLEIIYSINYEITINLLRGNTFNYYRLGEFSIIRVPYDNSIPDWGRSFQFRDFLKSQGVEPKSKDNPTGKNWFVDNGLGRTDFAIMRWRKTLARISNKAPYKFYPLTRGNIYGKKLEKPFTIEELFEHTTTGIFDKIIHIYKYHYDYCILNFRYVDFKNKTRLQNELIEKNSETEINL